MKIVPVKFPTEIPVQFYQWCIFETPEMAAMHTAHKFNMPMPETVYTFGHSVAVPLTGIAPEQYWQAVSNEV